MNLLSRRMVLMSAIGKTLLPKEYQQVEYLESTGGQYIDTEVIPDTYTGFSIDASFPDVVTDIFRFGCRNDSGETRFILATNNNFYFGYGKSINHSTNWRINPNVFYSMQLNFLNSRQAGGNGFPYFPIPATLPTMKYSIIMFGRNSAGSITSSAQTIKRCKISQGNEIIRDFIPCYRKADNVAGMYDVVNDKFYTNAGTGNFIVGGNV